MATVTASKSSGEYGGKKAGELRSVTITLAGNGFTVTEDRVPKMSKNGPVWEPSKPADSMVFETPEGALDYVGKCLGKPKKGPSAADEAAEKKGKE